MEGGSVPLVSALRFVSVAEVISINQLACALITEGSVEKCMYSHISQF